MCKKPILDFLDVLGGVGRGTRETDQKDFPTSTSVALIPPDYMVRARVCILAILRSTRLILNHSDVWFIFKQTGP